MNKLFYHPRCISLWLQQCFWHGFFLFAIRVARLANKCAAAGIVRHLDTRGRCRALVDSSSGSGSGNGDILPPEDAH